MNNDFSSRLKYAMNLRNVKQIDLANKLNLNRAIISQYLSGRYKPNHDRIFELSSILNVNPAWLMGFDLPIDADVEKVDELEFNTDLTNIIGKFTNDLLKEFPLEKKKEIYNNLIWYFDKLVKGIEENEEKQ